MSLLHSNPFYGSSLLHWKHDAYSNIHKYISLVICIVGISANFFHILVLTRPSMRTSAVNRLLALMAACDICTMLSYFIFNIRFSLLISAENPPFGYSLGWIWFLLAHVICTLALHTTSLYISVVTAYIRYHAMDRLASRWMMAASARPIFMIIVSLVGMSSIPTFFVHGIEKVDPTLTNNQTLYTIIFHEIAVANHCFLFKSNLWLTGILFKVIPCFLLLFFTIALLKKLNDNRRRRIFLKSYGNRIIKASSVPDRTTKMLTILLIIFLLTELPQGVLALLNGLFPNDIHQYIYLSVGEILDLFSLINCYACFIVYPCISTQYRETFREMLHQMNLCPRERSKLVANGRSITAVNLSGEELQYRDSDAFL